MSLRGATWILRGGYDQILRGSDAAASWLTRCSANATGLITRPAVYVAFTVPTIFISKICLTLLIRGSFTQRCDHGIRLFSHDGKVRILNFNSKCAF